jgi:hypothetical protein
MPSHFCHSTAVVEVAIEGIHYMLFGQPAAKNNDVASMV